MRIKSKLPDGYKTFDQMNKEELVIYKENLQRKIDENLEQIEKKKNLVNHLNNDIDKINELLNKQ